MLGTRSSGIFKVVGIALLIAAGVSLRAKELATPPLWADEAESTVNALTILEHGVPMNTYLGLPIFENTLINRWPESKEYEFKDDSYSDKGLAVYHSWIPLYSIAATLALFGIEPDRANEGIQILHPPESYAWRTLAPRVPALLFSVPFLLTLFWLGREIYGEDAGWTALAAGAISNRFVWFGRQARYYSATLALTAVCGWAIWRAVRRGRWLDFFLVGLCLALLFHCHTLSSLFMGGLFVSMIPFMRRHSKIPLKVLAAAAMALAGTLPWMLATGFLDHAVGIPKAWSLLSFPEDLFHFPMQYKAVILPGLLGTILLALLFFFHRSILHRILAPFRGGLEGFYFLIVWLVMAYASFVFLIPAASYFDRGVSMVVSIPGLLLTSILIAGFWRGTLPRYSTFLATLTILGLLLGSGRVSFGPPPKDLTELKDWKELEEVARGWNLTPGTRIYCTPNQHFLFQYYLGLPVQSVAPIRKSFFDEFDADLVLVDKSKPYSFLDLDSIRLIADRLGSPIESDPEARRTQSEIQDLSVRLALRSRVARVHPTPENPTPLESALIEAQMERTKEQIRERLERIPIYRGQPVETWTDSWPVFWYRFVDPDSRRGKNLNYAGILPQADAWVLPSTWIVYEWDRDGVPLMDSIKKVYERPIPGDD